MHKKDMKSTIKGDYHLNLDIVIRSLLTYYGERYDLLSICNLMVNDNNVHKDQNLDIGDICNECQQLDIHHIRHIAQMNKEKVKNFLNWQPILRLVDPFLSFCDFGNELLLMW